MQQALLLLGKIAVAQAVSPIATHFSVAWSVCLSIMLVHPAWTVRQIRQVRLWGSVEMTHCIGWSLLPPGEGETGVEPPSQHLHMPTYDSPEGSTGQRFCLLRNSFGLAIAVAVLLRYIHWTDQNFPKGGREGNVVNLMKLCAKLFKDDERYRNDERYINIWIKFVSVLRHAVSYVKARQQNCWFQPVNTPRNFTFRLNFCWASLLSESSV